MNRVARCGLVFGAACLSLLALIGSFSAQEENPPAEKHAFQALRDALKDVANAGAELFNKDGDHAGCYRVYQGALVAIKPLLPPGVQAEVTTALVEAEKLPRFSDRAFALRKAIDGIRAQGKSPGTEKKQPVPEGEGGE
jgi:hypothetical protein